LVNEEAPVASSPVGFRGQFFMQLPQFAFEVEVQCGHVGPESFAFGLRPADRVIVGGQSGVVSHSARDARSDGLCPAIYNTTGGQAARIHVAANRFIGAGG
jgi:hypothetical protein